MRAKIALVVATHRDFDLALRAMERGGLADPANRDKVYSEICFVTPDSADRMRGMRFTEAYFAQGWDRNAPSWEAHRVRQGLAERGITSKNCATLVL